MSIYNNTVAGKFQPTFLYIKQHSITGKLYFGKTVRQNPHYYKGSGKYWSRHITKHGKEHVVTLWYCLFLNKEDCVEFATNFSLQHDIVNSTLWANLKIETGTDGGNQKGVKGNKCSDETRRKLSVINTGKKQSVESCVKRSISLKGRVFTEDHLEKLRKPKPVRSQLHSQNISKTKKGIPWTEARRVAQNNRAKS